MVNATPCPLYHRERTPLPVLWEAEWAIQAALAFAEECLAHAGIRTSDGPARSGFFFLATDRMGFRINSNNLFNDIDFLFFLIYTQRFVCKV